MTSDCVRRRIGPGIAGAIIVCALAPPVAGAAAKPAPSAPGLGATMSRIVTPHAATTVAGRPILRTLTVLATAYGPSARDNRPYGAVDYFGQPLRFGMVAVDPAVIPLGTALFVRGYRDAILPAGGFVARALDEGDAIRGHRIDIFLPASPQAVSEFGIQKVTVEILGPGGD